MSLMVIRLSATEEKAISERAALCGKDKNEWVRESFVFSLKRMRMAAAFAELRSSLAPLAIRRRWLFPEDIVSHTRPCHPA